MKLMLKSLQIKTCKCETIIEKEQSGVLVRERVVGGMEWQEGRLVREYAYLKVTVTDKETV